MRAMTTRTDPVEHRQPDTTRGRLVAVGLAVGIVLLITYLGIDY